MSWPSTPQVIIDLERVTDDEWPALCRQAAQAALYTPSAAHLAWMAEQKEKREQADSAASESETLWRQTLSWMMGLGGD